MKKIRTKRGGASIFIVMFTIIILTIIVAGFTRVIVSEAVKTTNTDLSQSAYDSALAGVEDAKIALLRYHACLSKDYTATTGTAECRNIIKNMQEGIKKRDCSTVSNVLGREANASTEQSVVVQETQSSDQKGNNTSMLQAYTCVTIKEELEDYRTTLTSQSRLRVIPIRTADIDNLGYIRIKWFSLANQQQLASEGKSLNYCSDPTYSFMEAFFYPAGQCNGGDQAPTSIMARYIQTDEEYDLSELSLSRNKNSTDTGAVFLAPSNRNGETSLSKDVWGESADKGENKPYRIFCKPSEAWVCSVDIQLPETFRKSSNRNDGNTYLILSMPYGRPDTDVSVTTYLKDNDGVKEENRRDFTGVQARVDSTGRANDLYRRVETRIELVDTNYSYPEFEITLTDSQTDTLSKNFYTTFDCWYSNGDGERHTCANSGTVK